MCEILCHYQAWLLTVLKMGKCVIHQVKVLVAQMVKNLSVMQETWVQFLGEEDPLERAIATTSVFLAGESYEQRNLAGYSP